MSPEQLLERARTLSRQEFTAAHAGFYLMLSPRRGGEAAGFKTRVAHIDEEDNEPAESIDPQWAELHQVVKAPGNPYPDRISVGRARNCDVVLRDGSVSKLHAHFIKQPDGTLMLADLGSQNGTLVGGRPLAPNQPCPVESGVVLRFGVVVVSLLDAGRLHDLIAFSD